MELRDYLHEKKIRMEDFASMCDVGRIYMHYIKSGLRRPGAKLVRKIELVTDGNVTRYDLLKNHKDKIDLV